MLLCIIEFIVIAGCTPCPCNRYSFYSINYALHCSLFGFIPCLKCQVYLTTAFLPCLYLLLRSSILCSNDFLRSLLLGTGSNSLSSFSYILSFSQSLILSSTNSFETHFLYIGGLGSSFSCLF